MTRKCFLQQIQTITRLRIRQNSAFIKTRIPNCLYKRTEYPEKFFSQEKTSMCGRFALCTPPGTITQHFNISVQLECAPRYNIAPGQEIITIRQTEKDNRKTAYARWGLIPPWAKEEKIGYKMINARAETLFDKPSFSAAARHRRCLIPVSGFYEWKKYTSGKQPYFFRLKTSDLFALAGIWESRAD